MVHNMNVTKPIVVIMSPVCQLIFCGLILEQL